MDMEPGIRRRAKIATCPGSGRSFASEQVDRQRFQPMISRTLLAAKGFAGKEVKQPTRAMGLDLLHLDREDETCL